MHVTPLKCEAFEVLDSIAIDPVRFYIEDLGEGQGRLTIGCDSRAWTMRWKSPLSPIEFLKANDVGYLAGLMSGESPRFHFWLARIIRSLKDALENRVQISEAPSNSTLYGCSSVVTGDTGPRGRGDSIPMKCGYERRAADQGCVGCANRD